MLSYKQIQSYVVESEIFLEIQKLIGNKDISKDFTKEDGVWI